MTRSAGEAPIENVFEHAVFGEVSLITEMKDERYVERMIDQTSSSAMALYLRPYSEFFFAAPTLKTSNHYRGMSQ